MGEQQIFGQKNIFAIEVKGRLENCQSIVGLRVWVGGKSLGQIQDVGVVGVTVGALDALIARKDCLLSDIPFSFIEEKIKHNYDELSEDLKLRNPGESFDDFYIVVGRSGERVVFIWTLVECPFYEYPSCQKDVNQGSIDLGYFIEVVNDFKAAAKASTV